ncbi:MAG: aldehyde dehydrogenase family protein [Candidatus Andersenbacteria bacterium]|nr:aldehyde dehydrogenase family protein [Candidatus Andersenbacteria bacterium]
MFLAKKEYLISTNPAKGYKEVGRVPISTKEEVEISVQKAHEALPAWRALSIKNRGEYFQKFLALYKNRVEELADLQTREMGKPITESLSECNGRAATLELNIERSIKILEPQVLDTYDTHQTELHFEPHGVVAAITPWNYPTSQFLIAVGQPLLAGNTMVFKHSEECPLTSQFLEGLMKEAGFPDGVFTCLYGDGDVGEMLFNQNIDLIMFTGSSRVGEMVYKKAAEKFIPAVLEMGGSSPAIVFDDVNLDETCLSVFNERFSNNGQICCALKRLIVHESIHDQVVEKLTEIINTQVVGDPLNKKTTVGSLSAKRQLEALEVQVEDARSKGATIITGGKRVEGMDGAYYMPTLITNTTPDMKIVTEEVFGPVLPIITFKTEEEAIQIAHDTPYGLSAFVYSKNLERADRIAHTLEAGQVSINGCSYFSTNAPFGGYKRSGIGRTKGDIGFLQVTQQKVISRPIKK